MHQKMWCGINAPLNVLYAWCVLLTPLTLATLADGREGVVAVHVPASTVWRLLSAMHGFCFGEQCWVIPTPCPQPPTHTHTPPAHLDGSKTSHYKKNSCFPLTHLPTYLFVFCFCMCWRVCVFFRGGGGVWGRKGREYCLKGSASDDL